MVDMGREPWCAWCGQKLDQDDQRRLVDGVGYHEACLTVRERIVGPSWRATVMVWVAMGWSALLPLVATLGGLLSILIWRGSAE
jgi:hypothetical protein